LGAVTQDWRRYRPAIWLVFLGIALSILLNAIAGAAFIGAGVGVGVLIALGAGPRRWLK
jgi:hypothetical protein